MRDNAQTSAEIGNRPTVHVGFTGGRTMLRLRSWLPQPEHETPVVLGGQELPLQVGAVLSGPTRVLCLGPGEWLLVSQERDAPALRKSIEPNLATRGLVVVEVTGGVTTLEVRGPAARELLSKGCGLDLHSGRFPVGRCARTRFAQISVTIACLEEPPRFELYVGRSYGQYLHAWIVDAAAEFACGLG